MLIYRITHKQFSEQLYASGTEGRWNIEGIKVIYCAETIALAFLENVVRRQGIGFDSNFRIMTIEVPDSAKVLSIKAKDLPDGWRDFRDYKKCQAIGENWFLQGRALLLKVPSAILPESYNYVINTSHQDFATIKLKQTIKLDPDERIEEILKKYKS